MGKRIFIGSSTEAADSANALANDLHGRGHRATPWTGAFSLSAPIEGSLAVQLRESDYVVVLFTPDVKGSRGSSKAKSYPAPNLPFELGAAYGQKGLARTILVCDKNVAPPSDFAGVNYIEFEHQPGKAHQTMDRVGDRINKYIESQERASPTADQGTRPRIRWLALIKCMPAKQTELVKRIETLSQDTERKYGVALERCGVVWGLPDNFLLSSCREVQNYVDFIRKLRTTLDGLVAQVDSRLVFPASYWSNPNENDSYKHQELVLLSCRPAHVESVFEHLKKLGEQAVGDAQLQIAATGIAMGDADVFLITRATDGRHHRDFIERTLQPEISSWLQENTTSMPITSAWSSRGSSVR